MMMSSENRSWDGAERKEDDDDDALGDKGDNTRSQMCNHLRLGAIIIQWCATQSASSDTTGLIVLLTVILTRFSWNVVRIGTCWWLASKSIDPARATPMLQPESDHVTDRWKLRATFASIPFLCYDRTSASVIPRNPPRQVNVGSVNERKTVYQTGTSSPAKCAVQCAHMIDPRSSPSLIG